MATGLNTLSIRKRDLEGQKSLALGFKNLSFAHKAALGETGITLSALVTPSSEMPTYSAPSPTDLAGAKLFINRKNLTLVSSHKGILQQDLSYVVSSNDRINFKDFTSEDGEIFTGYIDSNSRTGLQVVDASPLVATGTVGIGATQFAVGTPYEVNKFSAQQQGAILVFVDGVLQFRNTGNAAASPSADGNYHELSSTVIEFNTPEAYVRNVVVVSNGLLVNAPDDSRDAAIAVLSATIDQMVPVLADAAGVPQAQFQSQPSQPELTGFANRVFKLERYRTHAVDFNVLADADRNLVDTTGGAVVATLPAAPKPGDWAEFWDSTSNWGTSDFIVNPNGQPIEGVVANFTVSTDDVRLKLVYVNGARGWIIGDMS